jgi:hypothetical protein
MQYQIKNQLWKAIEDYRSAGGREEHWARRDALDAFIEDLELQLCRTRALELAYEEWSTKTDWVQEAISSGKLSVKYLGWHRADVMTDLIKGGHV